jgi:hypothetical protein
MSEKLMVREITNDEGNRLLRIVRRSSGSVVTWRRTQVVLWSAQGMDVAQIAPLAFTRIREHHDPFEDLVAQEVALAAALLAVSGDSRPSLTQRRTI